jgi:hypothetical protein
MDQLRLDDRAFLAVLATMLLMLLASAGGFADAPGAPTVPSAAGQRDLSKSINQELAGEQPPGSTALEPGRSTNQTPHMELNQAIRR